MFEVKRVKSSEIKLLRDMAEHTFRVAFEADNNPADFKKYCDKAFTLDQIQAEFYNPLTEFWFGCLDKVPIANLKFNFGLTAEGLEAENPAQIERLYVLPEYQNLRLGTKLLDFATEYGRDNQVDYLWLSVWKFNPPAQRFYTRNGFEIFGEEMFVLGDDEQWDWLVRKKIL